MLYTDKEKLDRLPNSLSVATTETNGLMSAEDKEYLYSLGNMATYSFNNEIYSYSPGLMTGEDKKLLDDLSDDVDDLLNFMNNVNNLISPAEPSVSGEGGSNGLMPAEDKEKLNNITGISNNTKFEFCTANEYNQMTNRTAAIYFVLSGSTLLIKDANDNLLTLNNTGT